MFVQGRVVRLEVLWHAIPQRALLDVIEEAMLERVVENDILLPLVVDLRDHIRDERVAVELGVECIEATRADLAADLRASLE